MSKTFRYGFRILGDCRSERRLVMADRAFQAYAGCDEAAEVHSESFLSAFQFDEHFDAHMRIEKTTKGFKGPSWSRWLWCDIDNAEDRLQATQDARRLAACLVEQFDCEPEKLLLFFSGNKGFHVGVSTSLWNPVPSMVFHRVSRAMAEQLASAVGVVIDVSIYDPVRAFRAPNSRHPKSGLHKLRLSYDELQNRDVEAFLIDAKDPRPFDIPQDAATINDKLSAMWQEACSTVDAADEAKRQRQASGNGSGQLNRITLEFIRGADIAKGDRHRLLFSAAADLAGRGCPESLAHALLGEAGRDVGLTPSDVCRQIRCGHAAGLAGSADSSPVADVVEPPLPALPPEPIGVSPASLAGLWQSKGSTS